MPQHGQLYPHPSAMSSSSLRLSQFTALLAASVVWVVTTTLCPAGMFTERSLGSPESDEHSGHAHSAGHDHGSDSQDQDCGCGCAFFKAFPDQTTTALKVSVPAGSVLYLSVVQDEFTSNFCASAVTTQDTGPPGRLSLAELVLRQCRLSHAPPMVV